MSATLAPGLNPDTSTPARAAAVSFEDAHRYASVEYGAIIAPDGALLYSHRGDANQVSFTPQKLGLVADITFTHNHPKGRSFSVGDIELAAEYQMHEMRVVTANFRYFARGFAGVNHARILSEYQAHEPYAQHHVLGQVMAGTVRLTDMTVEAVHATWVRVGKSLGFTYDREPS